MIKKHTYETFSTKHFTLSLIFIFNVRESASYDTDLGTLTTELQIEGQEKSAQILDVNRLLTCIAECGIQPADLAVQETVALASAISFLGNSGRVVTDNARRQSIANDEQVPLSEILPRWEPPTLSRFELRLVNDKLEVVPQSYTIN